MTDRKWFIRTILISAVVGMAVYVHGRTDAVVKERFHKLWYEDPNTVWRNQWLGVPTEQNPNDAWIIQEIISEVKPDYIVEAGTFYGGSAVLWASILRELNPNGKVITIDIENKTGETRKLDIAQRMITFVIGSQPIRKSFRKSQSELRAKRPSNPGLDSYERTRAQRDGKLLGIGKRGKLFDRSGFRY